MNAGGSFCEFEAAHYPLSRKRRKQLTPLMPLDHALQGLWQWEEEGEVSFFHGDTKAALNAPGYLEMGWFEAYELYNKWFEINQSKARKKRSGTGCLSTHP